MATRPANEVLQACGLEVQPGDFMAFAHGEVMMMTKKELQMLVVLMRHEGRILDREALYALVWDDILTPGDRTVDAYVHKLRVRLQTEFPDRSFIHTHFGLGYRFSCQCRAKATPRAPRRPRNRNNSSRAT